MTVFRTSLCLLLLTIGVAAADQSLWPVSTTPQKQAYTADRRSVTLGLRFYSEVPGVVKAIRFYKGKQNTGKHIGGLWSYTGAKLAEVTFSGESESGWQQANLPVPFSITARTIYVISYLAPVGAYAMDDHYNWSAVPPSILHVAGSSPGVFAYGTGSNFPKTADRGNYWVDLVFEPVVTPVTYNLSGVITPSSTGGGAMLTLTGPLTKTVTADPSTGAYTFSSLPNGTYTVTPSKSGVVFSPPSQAVTVNGSNALANFSAAVQTWSISGALTPSSLGSAATVLLTGGATAYAIADASGNYSLPNLANGTYTVTPKKTGVVFNPSSVTLTINGAQATANFTASTPTWSISGAATISGTTLTLSGTAAASTTADASGNYSFGGLANGSYVVAPSRSGYSFSPSTALANINNASVSGVNFTAQAVPSSVTLSWIASTSTNVSGYNVYRATSTGGPYTKLNSSPVGALTFVDMAVSSGAAYFYVATSVDSNGTESAYSAEAAATVPTS